MMAPTTWVPMWAECESVALCVVSTVTMAELSSAELEYDLFDLLYEWCTSQESLRCMIKTHARRATTFCRTLHGHVCALGA
jgi:hypothetical protein